MGICVNTVESAETLETIKIYIGEGQILKVPFIHFKNKVYYILNLKLIFNIIKYVENGSVE